MIPYNKLREVIPAGLSKYLGITVIRGNQTAPAPAYPYGTYNVTTIASANNGTWEMHEDGIDRKLVKSVWSFSLLSDDWDESVELAIKARDWFDHSGRVWLADNGVFVQSVTGITNRDNILTVDYERKNGFDVTFYVYDEVETVVNIVGTIDNYDFNKEV